MGGGDGRFGGWGWVLCRHCCDPLSILNMNNRNLENLVLIFVFFLMTTMSNYKYSDDNETNDYDKHCS